jgi:hypothetical protein
LNVFLLEMASQFPEFLGIRRTDPMLSDAGIGSVPTAEAAMLEQAANRTATIAVGDVRINLAGTPAQSWKLKLVASGPVRVP